MTDKTQAPSGAEQEPAASAAVELTTEIELTWTDGERLEAARTSTALPDRVSLTLPLASPAWAGIGADGAPRLDTRAFLAARLEAGVDAVRAGIGAAMQRGVAAWVSEQYAELERRTAEAAVRDEATALAHTLVAERPEWEVRTYPYIQVARRAAGSSIGGYLVVGLMDSGAVLPRAEVAAEMDELERRDADNVRERSEREATERAEREAEAAERLAWADEHDPGLAERLRRGYDCSRRYIVGRLAVELPGWLDSQYDDGPDCWEAQKRACPSDEALAIEDEGRAAGVVEPDTRWLVAAWDGDDGPESGREAVVGHLRGRLVYRLTGVE